MKNIRRTYLYSLCLILIASCSEKQDFDQAKDLEIITDVSGPILYIESPESLINDVNESNFITQNVNFDGFNSDVFSKRVISGSLKFQIENTTSKQLDFTIDFLDNTGSVLDSEFFSISASPPTIVIDREIFYGLPSGRSIEIIKNTSSFQLTAINNSGNTSTSNNNDPKVVFRSSGSFKLNLIE
tara:strand:+ start:4730 stop:5284 length:555 start_codon:yes stop_codon:yes gene_type:complete